jgi:hypothetical protein
MLLFFSKKCVENSQGCAHPVDICIACVCVCLCVCLCLYVCVCVCVCVCVYVAYIKIAYI